MANTSSKFSFIGIALGAAALLLAITHFWADPMASQGTAYGWR